MQTKISWFEIPSADFNRAVRFYESIFDTELAREPYGDHQLGIFSAPDRGGVGCVIHGDNAKPSATGSLMYLDAGESIDRVLARIEPAGGSIKLAKTELPDNMGFFAHFMDTEGNLVALHAMQ